MMALDKSSVSFQLVLELTMASRGDTYQTNVLGKKQGGSLKAASISHGS